MYASSTESSDVKSKFILFFGAVNPPGRDTRVVRIKLNLQKYGHFMEGLYLFIFIFNFFKKLIYKIMCIQSQRSIQSNQRERENREGPRKRSAVCSQNMLIKGIAGYQVGLTGFRMVLKE